MSDIDEVSYLENNNYLDNCYSLLVKAFEPAGYQITKEISYDSIPESSKYHGLNFSLNENKIIYRKGKVTQDRPGAFLTLWQRPKSGPCKNPIPLMAADLDYLFVQVQDNADSKRNSGLFIFPVSILVQKGILSSEKYKGKTAFRVFPPWSRDRGSAGSLVFTPSGRKTQRWQSSYFVEIDRDGLIDIIKLNRLLTI